MCSDPTEAATDRDLLRFQKKRLFSPSAAARWGYRDGQRLLRGRKVSGEIGLGFASEIAETMAFLGSYFVPNFSVGTVRRV